MISAGLKVSFKKNLTWKEMCIKKTWMQWNLTEKQKNVLCKSLEMKDERWNAIYLQDILFAPPLHIKCRWLSSKTLLCLSNFIEFLYSQIFSVGTGTRTDAGVQDKMNTHTEKQKHPHSGMQKWI